jgi:hypothetical protein
MQRFTMKPASASGQLQHPARVAADRLRRRGLKSSQRYRNHPSGCWRAAVYKYGVAPAPRQTSLLCHNSSTVADGPGWESTPPGDTHPLPIPSTHMPSQIQQQQQQQRLWQRVLVITAGCLLLCNFHRSTFSVLLPELVTQLQLSPTQTGMVNASLLSTYLIGQIPAGRRVTAICG